MGRPRDSAVCGIQYECIDILVTNSVKTPKINVFMQKWFKQRCVRTYFDLIVSSADSDVCLWSGSPLADIDVLRADINSGLSEIMI